jgi:TPR repeat protein
MRSIVRNIAVPVCVVAIGAAAIIWNLQRTAFTKRKLADEARVAQGLANQGDANGEYDLGRMYLWGSGVTQDDAQADYWYHKAAAQGLAKANYAIGNLYYYGRGLEQSDPDALVWYHKAADQGDSIAQYAVGLMYYYGRGVPQSYPEAMVWYRKAADQSYATAEYDIGKMYWYGQGVSSDRDEANRWFRKAADQGDRYAQEALGLRLAPLGSWAKITNAIGLFAGCLLISGLRSPQRLLRDQNQRRFVLAGAFSLVTAGMSFYAHSEYCLFPSMRAATAYLFARSFLGGIVITLLVTALKPRAGKLLLILSGILFVVLDVSLWAVARSDVRILSTLTERLVLLDSFLIGIAISAAIYLWRKRNEPTDDDSAPPAEETEAPGAG